MTLSKLNIAARTGLAGDFLEVDFPALYANETIREEAFVLGIVNKIRDSHASMTSKWYAALDADKRTGTLAVMKRARADAVLASLVAGEWSTRAESTGPRITDPVDKEAKRLALETINALVKGWNAKSPDATARATLAEIGLVLSLPFDKGSDEQGAAIIAEAVSRRMKREDVMAQACKNVAEREEQVTKASSAIKALF